MDDITLGDMVEVVLDEELYKNIGKPVDAMRSFGISGWKSYQGKQWFIGHMRGSWHPRTYRLEGDPAVFDWPRWLLCKVQKSPDWEV